jgi:hypothetical protein
MMVVNGEGQKRRGCHITRYYLGFCLFYRKLFNNDAILTAGIKAFNEIVSKEGF